MADTTSRALTLLSLLQARRTWSGAELMDRLRVSERTLRRDIDRLRELGYQVRAVTGPSGGYRLEAGTDIPPLLLDDEEAVAIAMGLLTAAGGTIAGIEETSARALAKLEKVLPPRIRRRVATIQSTVVPVIRAWITVDSEILTTVAQACRDHERLRFDYETRDGDTSERHVEPHRLVSRHHRWYLLAFDREREDWRTFRLDRMSSPLATRVRFEPREIPGGDAAQFIANSFRSIPVRYEVSAIVHASADAIAGRVHADEGDIEAIDDDTCRLRTRGDHLEWLAFQLIWLGAEFEVEGPDEFVQHVRALARRLSRAVSG